MGEDPTKQLKIAVIFSYAQNEEEADGIIDEENPEDTSALDKSSRDFLEEAILDYNTMFHTAYDTSSDKFQNYYKDVSLRMKNKELDLLIVVNMFLTGFDATTLNTLWVDKNLKMHGLIQAFSRTNRILNSIKTFGNIVCFRSLQKRVDSAISWFGDENAGGIVLLRSFKDYYEGYISNDKHMPGYKNNYRSADNFLKSDVIVMDCDNDHTENPDEWITPEALDEILTDISYAIAPSRHNMLSKDGKAARPKFHVYFSIEELTDAEGYVAIKKAIHAQFPFFDDNALDAARFIYGADGAEHPVVREMPSHPMR
jgi:hypothetical protein